MLSLANPWSVQRPGAGPVVCSDLPTRAGAGCDPGFSRVG